MDKIDFIKYWLDLSQEDFEVSMDLFEKNRYLQVLFFLHLSTEKLAKALWVKNNTDNYPPKTHNILKILYEAGISLSENDEVFLADLNNFQIEGRYPDYISNVSKRLNHVFTENYINKTKVLRQWLLKQV